MWSQYHIRPHNLKLEIHFLAIPVKILTTSFSPGHVFRSMLTFFQKKAELLSRKTRLATACLISGSARVPSLAHSPHWMLGYKEGPNETVSLKSCRKYRLHIAHSEWKTQMFNGVVFSLHEPLKIFCTASIKAMKELFYEAQTVSNTAISVPVTSQRPLWLLLWTPNPENVLSPSPGNSDLLH